MSLNLSSLSFLILLSCSSSCFNASFLAFSASCSALFAHQPHHHFFDAVAHAHGTHQLLVLFSN
jgi:hypothetical protein